MNTATLTQNADQTAPKTLVFACWVEGLTLIILLLVAVPLKHLGGLEAATKIMGPIHGLAFLVYVWMLASHLPALPLPVMSKIWITLSGFIPFGFLKSHRILAQIGRP